MEATLRRLHVGGVGPSVTDIELSERFGRFGKVDEVEIISRKDDQGNPIKTFAYININISDADLKKCTSLLNKTKWKGGVLQVEIAKESFLHKLEQERQAAKEKKKSKEQSHPQNDLLQSLEKAGVTDFQMKAAVPGTEVPNHKNWVVSKYGRVLPVLHLKGNKQSKIMKCDPSKYCHNIKKLDVPVEATPVSQLTWHLDGGEDEISKKRRGEFSEYSPVKKSKVNSYSNRSKSDEKGQSVRTPQTTLQKANDVLAAQHKREKSRGKVGNRSMNSMSDEYDSEEELKAVIEREKMVQESGRHSEDNSIEVVDDSFTPKYKTHWAEEIGKHGSTKDDKEYDSADTDEIITVAKTTKNCSNSKKEKARNSNGVSSELKISKCNMKRKAKEESGTEEESQSNDSEVEDSSDSYSDEEYESMMQNCYRLDLSMGDLEALAIEAGQSGSENTDSDQEVDSADNIAETSVQSDGVGELKGLNGHQTTKKKQKSKAASAGDLGPVTCNIGVSSELKISKCNMKRKAKEESGTEEESQSNDSEAEDSSDSYSDEEYESMMQNCYRLDLSMGDLEALVKEAGQSGSENTDTDQEVDSADNIAETSVQSDGVGELKGLNGHQTTKKKQKSKAASAGDLGPVNNKRSESSSSLSERESGSMEQDLTVGKFKSVSKRSSNIDDGTDVPSEDVKAATKTRKEAKNYQKAEVIGNQKRKKGIEPDDIVTSILEDDEDSANDRRKRKKKNPPVLPPAFKGLGSLMPLSNSSEPKASMSCGQNTPVVDVGNTKQDSKTNSQIPPKPVKTTSPNVQQRSERDDDDGGSSSSSSSSSGSSSDESSSDEPSSTSSPLAKPKVTPKSSTKEQPISKAKQLQDNQKRLAAMEERRKEREQQKQAIQGALTKLDSQSANNSQHIVFNSESEEESEKEEEASTSNVQSDNMVTHAKSKLFDSSGEDSDDEEEKDDERFEIKTQYEGRSGAKLMQLQSRFGTDERFKMDARFLEDSSEEDEEQPQKLQADDDDDDDDGLSAEKKRNLDILQSVLKINVEPQPAGKKAKAKKFKDLNALQYDPTKEDHALFETKAEEEKKESKSEIKKKRLEAEKLPEVSKELFHEVTEDLKDVFSAPKPQTMEVPETTWDQIEKPQKIEAESSMADVDFSFQKKEESAGFTFSFFGTRTEESAPFDEPYKIETIKAAKVAWQENPRFQDSSSEGEEEEEKDNSVTTSSQVEKSSSIRFFFFVKDDTRLKEGPKMFFRSSKSQQKAKEWDYMRDTIMEECKKRHKDAKRKLKSKR